MSASKYTYTWKIPTITNIQKDLLCHGFTRLNYKKFIIQPIIDLFAWYLVKDKYTLNDIKNGVNNQYFCSLIFTLQSFKWYLKLTLDKDKHTSKNNILASLNLASNPPNISSIRIDYTLLLKETKTHFFHIHKFTPNHSAQQIGPLQLDQLVNFNQLTFILEMKVTQLRNESGHKIENHQGLITIREYMESDISNTSNECPLIQYKWNTNPHTQIRSKIFTANSLKFFLELVPNNSSNSMTLLIHLVSLTSQLSLLCTKCKLIITETDSEYIFMHNFDKNNMMVSKIFSYCTNIKQLSISLEMIIFDLYGKHGQTIGIENYFDKKIFNQSEISFPPVDKYQWNIKKKLMEKFKHASNMQEITCRPFCMCGLIWTIEILPNGYIEGNVGLFLRLLSLPPTISQITIDTTVYIEEIEVCLKCINEFESNNRCWGWKAMFPTQQIQNLNELTIRLETMIFDCYDINGNVIQNYVEKNSAIPKQINLPTDVTYEWKIWKSHKMNEIKNAKNGETFYSNPFKMEKLLKWRLKLYPFGSND
eukprot:65455_1